MRVKLTLSVDEQVIMQAKKWCIDNKVTLSGLIEELLMEALKMEVADNDGQGTERSEA